MRIMNNVSGDIYDPTLGLHQCYLGILQQGLNKGLREEVYKLFSYRPSHNPIVLYEAGEEMKWPVRQRLRYDLTVTQELWTVPRLWKGKDGTFAERVHVHTRETIR